MYMWIIVICRASDYWLGTPSRGTRWVPRGSRGLILGSTGRGRPRLQPAIVFPITGTTPPGNRRVGDSTKATIRFVLRQVRANVALNSILRELELRPSQTLSVHPAYSQREESDYGEPGYYGRLLLNRLYSWAETSPLTVNVWSAECFKAGQGKSDVRFFTISVNRGKEGITLTATVRIVMSTYPIDIPLFPLQRAIIGLLLSDNEGDGIWDKLSWKDRYRPAALIQGKKGRRTNLHLYMTQCQAGLRRQ